MKRLERLTFLICLLAVSVISIGQNIPTKPDPFKFVNDFADVISNDIEDDLNNQLGVYSLESTIQIVVVTVESLDGDTPASFAQQIGEQWGVGQREENNGVVILIKPKTETEKGEAFIATGYGMEETLTDAVCSRIVNEGMIEYFKKNDYGGGAICGAMAVKAIMSGSSLSDALDSDYSTPQTEEEEMASETDVEPMSNWELFFLAIFFYFFLMWPPVFVCRLIYALFTHDWSSFKPRWAILLFGFWWVKAACGVFLGGMTGGSSGGGGGGYSSGGGSFGGGGGGGSW